MLIRLVRMTFQPDRTRDFLRIFDESSAHIKAFPGCARLELWKDLEHPNVFTTLSHWESDEHLQRYRASDLFRSTWARTKPLFAARPHAFSHTVVRRDHDRRST